MPITDDRIPPYIITAVELAEIAGMTTEKLLKEVDDSGLVRMEGRKIGVRPECVGAFLRKKWGAPSFQVAAHVNLKGGIGKTTTAITAATRAVQYGRKTCILDMDSQGSATLAFDAVPEDDDPVFGDIWQKPEDMLMGSLKEIQEYLYILPSSLQNGLLDVTLMNPSSQKNAVRGVCAVLKENGFDLVMIDCPPSLGSAVISSVCAADTVVIPVGHDAFSFKGLELSLEEIRSICNTFGLQLPDIKILFTKYDRRVNISIDALKRLKRAFHSEFIPTPIRTSTEYAKALEKKQTVFASRRKSDAKADYDRYVRHVLGIGAE